MKWNTNFIKRLDSYNIILWVSMWVGIAVIVMTIILLLVDNYYIYRAIQKGREEYSLVTEQLTTIQSGVSENRTSDEISALQEKVVILNELSIGTQLPTNVLFSFLERKLPSDVRIKELLYKELKQDVNLIVETENEKSFGEFLKALEETPVFKNVLLEQRQYGEYQGKSLFTFYIHFNTEINQSKGAG